MRIPLRPSSDSAPGLLFFLGLHSHFEPVELFAKALNGFPILVRHVPDLILCDALMPGQTGPEVVFNLRADAATAHIPVILMTSGARTFQEVPCAGFLTKPFLPSELQAIVESATRVRVQHGGT
jgi:CheY-like chemotaxis protein